MHRELTGSVILVIVPLIFIIHSEFIEIYLALNGLTRTATLTDDMILFLAASYLLFLLLINYY